MKEFNTGLILGSFDPPHKGHIYLIDTSYKYVNKLYVIIGTRDDEKNCKERYQSLRYYYSSNPNIIVMRLHHNFDDYPGEHGTTKDEFYKKWVDMIYSKINDKIDVVFTSENYGDEFADYLGVKHIMIDKERRNVSISATDIRNNIVGKWNFLPDVVKPIYTKKIVMVGPESSGKTTMSNMLSERLSTSMVREYGADYIDNLDMNKNTRNNKDFTIMDINHIAAGQIYLEDMASTGGNKIIICDTDLMTTQIWSEIYFGTCPKWIVDESYNRKYYMHFLMDIDFDWKDEGIREFPDKRQWHFNRIKSELDKRKLRYEIISGNPEERLNKILKRISSILL